MAFSSLNKVFNYSGIDTYAVFEKDTATFRSTSTTNTNPTSNFFKLLTSSNGSSWSQVYTNSNTGEFRTTFSANTIVRFGFNGNNVDRLITFASSFDSGNQYFISGNITVLDRTNTGNDAVVTNLIIAKVSDLTALGFTPNDVTWLTLYESMAMESEAATIGGILSTNSVLIVRDGSLDGYGCTLKSDALTYVENQCVRYCDIRPYLYFKIKYILLGSYATGYVTETSNLCYRMSSGSTWSNNYFYQLVNEKDKSAIGSSLSGIFNGLTFMNLRNRPGSGSTVPAVSFIIAGFSGNTNYGSNDYKLSIAICRNMDETSSAAGTHIYNWPAKTDTGSTLPADAYYYINNFGAVHSEILESESALADIILAINSGYTITGDGTYDNPYNIYMHAIANTGSNGAFTGNNTMIANIELNASSLYVNGFRSTIDIINGTQMEVGPNGTAEYNSTTGMWKFTVSGSSTSYNYAARWKMTDSFKARLFSNYTGFTIALTVQEISYTGNRYSAYVSFPEITEADGKQGRGWGYICNARGFTNLTTKSRLYAVYTFSTNTLAYYQGTGTNTITARNSVANFVPADKFISDFVLYNYITICQLHKNNTALQMYAKNLKIYNYPMTTTQMQTELTNNPL